MKYTYKNLNIEEVGKALAELSTLELKERFAKAYGFTTQSRNRSHIIHRLLWTAQRDAAGDISDAARKKALAIEDDRDVRERFPRSPIPLQQPQQENKVTLSFSPTPQLLPGTVLHRTFKGKEIRLLVLEEGFEWEGKHFTSLSAAATHIAGSRWNGWAFFGLKKKEASHGRS